MVKIVKDELVKLMAEQRVICGKGNPAIVLVAGLQQERQPSPQAGPLPEE
jgi:signal recognition particle GTPase